MIIGIFGSLSQGKTVFAVKLLYDSLKEQVPKKIISNTKLAFPSVYLDLDTMYDKSKNDIQFFSNSILFLDEISHLVDARRSNSVLNQEFTSLFLTQVGKLSTDLIFTSQIFSSQIDIRLRELCDILCFCEKIDVKGNSLYLAPRIIKDKIFIKVIVVIKRFGGLIDSSSEFSFDPQPYYKLYNTREIITLDRTKYIRK